MLAATASGDIFFSLTPATPETSLPGIGVVNPADVVRYDGSAFSFAFRGQDFGLGAADVDAFSFLSGSELLLSFASTVDVPGVGTVGCSDVVLFVADQPHDLSAGTFSMYFDGSDVGLSSSAPDNVVAIDVLENGDLVLSTAGDVTVSAANGSSIPVGRVDLLRFAPTSLGAQTAGSWSMYFDGSDVGLSNPTESINAVSVGPDGQLFLSTVGSFFTGAVAGDNEDIVEFIPQQLGEDTSGSFVSPLLFNGNVVAPALLSKNINALEVASIENADENTPPIAEPEMVSTPEDTPLAVQLTGDDGDPDVAQTLTFAIVDGPSHGTIASFDVATGQLEYIPDPDFNGTDSFSFVVTDDDTAGGEALTSEAAVVTIEVTAVNDAPVNAVPQRRFVGNEDLPVLIKGVSVHDVDAADGTGLVMVKLSVASGTLQLASVDPADLTVDGNGSQSVVITGPLVSINSLLAEGITYQGALNFSGKDWLKVVTSDLGNTGEGGVLTATSGVGIKVRSTQEQLQVIHRKINRLVEAGRLNPWIGWWLRRTLWTGGNEYALAWRIPLFIRSVDVLRDYGLLTANQHRFFTEAANDIREGLLIGGRWAQQPRYCWWW